MAQHKYQPGILQVKILCKYSHNLWTFEKKTKALLWHRTPRNVMLESALFEFRKVVGLFKFRNCLAVLPVDIVQQRQKTREKRASSDVEWMKLRNSGWEEHPYPLDLKLLSPFVFTWHKTTPISLLTLAIASRTASWVNWLMKRAEDASGIWAICFVGRRWNDKKYFSVNYFADQFNREFVYVYLSTTTKSC